MTDKNKTIFVSIPTMNDKEYFPTVERLFESAKNPERITVGTTIFWKKKDLNSEGAPFFYSLEKKINNFNKNIKFDIVYWENSPGVGNGRLQPLKHYSNEDYYLSLDSHTSFVKDWDEKLINEYEDAKKYFGKRIILTTYLLPYNHKKDLDVITNKESYSSNVEGLDIFEYKDIVFNKNNKISLWQFFDYNGPRALNYSNDNYIFPLPNDVNLNNVENNILNHLIDDRYLPAKKISAHFLFTEADPWVTKFNINLDGRINFWLEEFYQSSLSYARGYNFVWTKNVFFFHKYLSSGEQGRQSKNIESYESVESQHLFYIKHIKNLKINNPVVLHENEIIKNLILKKEYFGYLPRSTISFQKYSGIDLDILKCLPWWKVPEIDIIYK